MAPNTVPFADPASPFISTLRLALRPGDDAPPLQPGHPPEVVVCGDGFEFIRPQGTLRADAAFTDCEVLLSPAPPMPFTGQPWLMLALWGHLTHREGLFLHGACCELDGRFILLLGPRQAGKSTLARLVLQAGGACLTDEYPLVRRDRSTLAAYGSPWPGVQGPWAALGGPLDAVFYLHHATTNKLSVLSPLRAARQITTNNRFFTWSPVTLPVAFDLVDQLSREIPVYDFGFVPDQSAVAELRRVL